MRNFHPNAVRGMMASIAIDFQIPILYTRNYRDTSKLISVMAKRMEKPRKLSSLLIQRKPLTAKEQQETIIGSFPGIGPEISKILLKDFKTIKNFANADIEKLKTVEKIGEKKAQKIAELLEKYYVE